MNADLAAAALALVGTRFRLHGRDPHTGLDCVGLVAEAMRCAGRAPQVPHGYAIRTASLAPFLPFAAANGLVEVPRDADIVLVMANLVQPHLMIAVPGGFAHAHAGIGRVTFLPGASGWPIARQWRLPHPRS